MTVVPNVPNGTPVVSNALDVVLGVPNDPLTVSNVPNVFRSVSDDSLAVANVSDIMVSVPGDPLAVSLPLVSPALVSLPTQAVFKPINRIEEGSLLHIEPSGSFCQSAHDIRFMVLHQ
jgi:hypothetical protein